MLRKRIGAFLSFNFFFLHSRRVRTFFLYWIFNDNSTQFLRDQFLLERISRYRHRECHERPHYIRGLLRDFVHLPNFLFHVSLTYSQSWVEKLTTTFRFFSIASCCCASVIPFYQAWKEGRSFRAISSVLIGRKGSLIKRSTRAAGVCQASELCLPISSSLVFSLFLSLSSIQLKPKYICIYFMYITEYNFYRCAAHPSIYSKY